MVELIKYLMTVILSTSDVALRESRDPHWI